MRSFSGNTPYLYNGDGVVCRCAICDPYSAQRRSTGSRCSSPLPTPPSSASHIVPVNEAVTAASQIIAYRPSCEQTSRRTAERPHDSRSREYSVKATGLGNSSAFGLCCPFMHPTLSLPALSLPLPAALSLPATLVNCTPLSSISCHSLPVPATLSVPTTLSSPHPAAPTPGHPFPFSHTVVVTRVF
jgi:hypothetical protein